MTGAVAQFDAQLAQISATVNAVVGATWTGSAADAFLEEWTSFLASAALTRESIVSIATRLHAAQAGYDGNEGQLTAASRSSTVNIRMPGSSGGSGSAAESGQAAPQVQAAPAEAAPMVIDIQATGVADA